MIGMERGQFDCISYNIMCVCICVCVRVFVALCMKKKRFTDIMYQIWKLTMVIFPFFVPTSMDQITRVQIIKMIKCCCP
jgi:hypothetical protein